jgi:hypothetical protein
MNLNRIQLPASVVAGLYKHSLVEIDTESPSRPIPFSLEKSEKSGDRWKYLGENKKNILIAVNYNNAFYLPDDELSFLTNMLSACKLSLADVAIVNKNNYDEISYKEMVAQFASRIVFLFDIDPALFGMPINFPHFQLQPFANATFLFTPSLEDMQKDSLLKSKLWLCLRRLFSI